MAHNTASISSNGLTSAENTELLNLLGNSQVKMVLLGKLAGANMNSTADQAITIHSTKYIVTQVVTTNASTSLTTAAGGLYAGASKTNALVGSGQLYTALTASTKFASLTLATLAGTDVRTEGALYLSLTLGQGSAATADVYVFGLRLD